MTLRSLCKLLAALPPECDAWQVYVQSDIAVEPCRVVCLLPVGPGDAVGARVELRSTLGYPETEPGVCECGDDESGDAAEQ